MDVIVAFDIGIRFGFIFASIICVWIIVIINYIVEINKNQRFKEFIREHKLVDTYAKWFEKKREKKSNAWKEVFK